MKWTPAEYQQAKSLQSNGQADAEFNGLIRDYERLHGMTEDVAAEEGSATQQFPTRSAPMLAPQSELPRDIEGQRLIEENMMFDKGLANASKRKFVLAHDAVGNAVHVPFFVPPEYINQDASMRVDPLRGPMLFVPKEFGGGTDVWPEPSLEEFRNSRKDKGAGLGLDSDEYKEFADRMWAQRVDEARQNGENVVRPAYMKRPLTKLEQISADRNGEQGILSAGLLGLSSMVAPGMTKPLARATGRDVDAIEPTLEEHPIAAAAGGLAGAMTPEALPARLGGLLGAALPKATGLVGSTLRGAAQAGGTVAALNAAEDIGNGETPSLHPGSLGAAAALGGLGGLGGAAYRGLRSGERGRELNILEMALGEGESPERATRLFRGPRMPDAVTEAQTRTRTVGPDFGATETDVLASDAAGPIVKNATERLRTATSNLEQVKQYFYGTNEGKAPVQVKNFAEAAMDIVQGRQTGFEGALERPLPGVNLPAFKTVLNRTVNASVIPELEVQTALQRDPTARAISLRTAVDRGLDLPFSPAELGQMVEDGGHAVLMRPRALDARAIDEVAQGVDNLAKEGTRAGADDPAWRRLQRSIRDDRDGIRWPKELGPAPTAEVEVTNPDGTTGTKVVRGWSAIHANAAKVFSGLESDMRLAGIPAGQGVSEDEMLRGVQKQALGFRTPDRGAEDEALMSFMPQGTAPLWNVAAARYGPGLAAPPSGRAYISSGEPRAALVGLGPALRLGLDPVAAFLASRGQPLAVATGAGGLGPGVASAVSEAREATPFTVSDMLDQLKTRKKKPKEKGR